MFGKKEEIKLLKLGKGVADYYRNNVRDNELTSEDQIRRKLTRNVLLAKQHNENEYIVGFKLYTYGKLLILVENGKKVVWLKNYNDDSCNEFMGCFRKDKKKYRELNEKLGIVD